MQPALVPDDVVRLLEDRGQAVVAAVGTDGAWWVAHPVPGGAAAPLEVQVVRVPADDRLRDLAARLRGVVHPHLAAVQDVVPLDAGRVAVLVEHVPGPTLAAVRAARPPLTDGEAVTVTVPVAQALGALHDAGLAHAAVTADRVVVRPDGFPVLVDVRGVLTGLGTADGDVRRLVATVLGVLPPLEAQLAADLPELVRLRGALEAVARQAAPRTQDVVDAAFGAAAPEPVQLPDPDALAGAQVALAAGRTLPRTGGPEVPARRERPARRRGAWRVVAVAAALVLVVGGAAAVRSLRGDGTTSDADRARGAAATSAAEGTPGAAPATPAGERDAAESDPAEHDPAERDPAERDPAERDRAERDPAESDPGESADAVLTAAVDLTRLRAEALAAASPEGLAEVHVPGSPALARDLEVLRRLAGARSEGLAVEVAGVTPAGRTPEGDAVVAVRSAVAAHTRVAATGERTTVPAGAPRTVELVLRRTADGWRVWDVREPGGPS